MMGEFFFSFDNNEHFKYLVYKNSSFKKSQNAFCNVIHKASCLILSTKLFNTEI